MIDNKLNQISVPSQERVGPITLRVIRYVNPNYLLFFIILHIPLGLIFRLDSLFPTVHAIITLALGLIYLMNDRQPTRVIYTIAYITGVEVLWRAAGAYIFWETGKYAILVLLLLTLIKFCQGVKLAHWPIIFIALLLPSIFLLPNFDREAIAFNLAGPIILAVAVIFFNMIRIDLEVFKQTMVSLLAPIVALGFFVLGNIISTKNIFFGTGSNFVTSGGYGPNQVSSILALGGLAAIFIVLLEQKKIMRFLFLGIGLWLLVQSVVTFSRSGLWTTIITLFVVGLYLLRVPQKRTWFIIVSLLFGLLSYSFLFPLLENYTGNKLGVRYSSLDSSGRFEIIQADLITFEKYPLFGVGPSQSSTLHSITFRESHAHTEYSRMLAEHGVLGLIALCILLFATLNRFLSKDGYFTKAFIIGMTSWALLYMAHSATRLVAPSFLFGLAAVSLLLYRRPIGKTKNTNLDVGNL